MIGIPRIHTHRCLWQAWTVRRGRNRAHFQCLRRKVLFPLEGTRSLTVHGSIKRAMMVSVIDSQKSIFYSAGSRGAGEARKWTWGPLARPEKGGGRLLGPRPILRNRFPRTRSSVSKQQGIRKHVEEPGKGVKLLHFMIPKSGSQWWECEALV